MLPRFELLATLWAELQLSTVTPFLAGTANVRRSSVMDFQTPKLGKTASAARIRTVKPVFILSAFDPVILRYVFRPLHSLSRNQATVAGAVAPSNDGECCSKRQGKESVPSKSSVKAYKHDSACMATSAGHQFTAINNVPGGMMTSLTRSNKGEKCSPNACKTEPLQPR